jgi:hypothetical protein
MSGFAVVPEVWASAGKDIGDASDVLAGGLDAFCFALGDGSPFGGDPLGRAAFSGDQGSPGFAQLRDGLIRDLTAAVNLLRAAYGRAWSTRPAGTSRRTARSWTSCSGPAV